MENDQVSEHLKKLHKQLIFIGEALENIKANVCVAMSILPKEFRETSLKSTFELLAGVEQKSKSLEELLGDASIEVGRVEEFLLRQHRILA